MLIKRHFLVIDANFQERLGSRRLARLPVPIGKNLGARGYTLLDLLVQAGKQFADGFAVDRLIRQSDFQRWYSQIVLVTRNFASLIYSIQAEQETHFFLGQCNFLASQS